MKAAVVLVVVAVGCSHIGPDRRPSDADVALDVAGELEQAHRYAIARVQLAAIADAVGPAEAEELRLRACRTFALEGDTDGARACYGEARAATAQGADADARATQREQEAKAARALLANADETEGFIAAYADTDAARRAFIGVLEDKRNQGGCPAELALLTRLEAAIADAAGRPLTAEIAVKRADLLFTDCRDDGAVVAAAEHAVQLSAKTSWSDDAEWILGLAAERTGKVDEALTAYTRIIDSRSDAWIFGSNDSLFLDDAWLAKGLLLEKLGRPKEATRVLHDLIDARPTSRLRDDAERALKRMSA